MAQGASALAGRRPLSRLRPDRSDALRLTAYLATLQCAARGRPRRREMKRIVARSRSRRARGARAAKAARAGTRNPAAAEAPPPATPSVRAAARARYLQALLPDVPRRLGAGDGFNAFNLDPRPRDLSDPEFQKRRASRARRCDPAGRGRRGPLRADAPVGPHALARADGPCHPVFALYGEALARLRSASGSFLLPGLSGWSCGWSVRSRRVSSSFSISSARNVGGRFFARELDPGTLRGRCAQRGLPKWSEAPA